MDGTDRSHPSDQGRRRNASSTTPEEGHYETANAHSVERPDRPRNTSLTTPEEGRCLANAHSVDGTDRSYLSHRRRRRNPDPTRPEEGHQEVNAHPTDGGDRPYERDIGRRRNIASTVEEGHLARFERDEGATVHDSYNTDGHPDSPSRDRNKRVRFVDVEEDSLIPTRQAISPRSRLAGTRKEQTCPFC